MTKKLFIGSLFALALTACASQVALDDAYYWSDEASVMNNELNRSNAAETSQSPIDHPITPVVEYLNVQDTTVTIRIKK